MRLFNFMISDDLDARVRGESVRTGAPMAEVVRRAIDAYLGEAAGRGMGTRPRISKDTEGTRGHLEQP